MKKEEADLLVAALRSGKYKQNKGSLRRGDAFCCLGVYCDIKGVEWSPHELGEGIFKAKHSESDDYSYYLLTDYYCELGGFKSVSGGTDECVLATVPEELEPEGFRNLYMLSELNDSGFTFERIADIIEKNWEHI